MAYTKSIPKQPQCDQTLELVLGAIETAGIGCHALTEHDIKKNEVELTFDENRCRRDTDN